MTPMDYFHAGAIVIIAALSGSRLFMRPSADTRRDIWTILIVSALAGINLARAILAS